MNAKQELLRVTTNQSIRCASIHLKMSYEQYKIINLPLDYSPEQYEEFLSALDFEYDNGYGGQELYGTVWLTDNTWLSREEYDGSEWWEHNVLPEMPEYLLHKTTPISYFKDMHIDDDDLD